MNNYEYIVASLPVIEPDTRFGSSEIIDNIIEEVREQLSSKDSLLLTKLLEGYDPDKLDAGFYKDCLSSSCRFIRQYFLYDLMLRNTKVEYLNTTLGRPEGKDILHLEGLEEQEFEQHDEIMEILSRKDIIDRERGLDMATWSYIDELNTMDFFDLDAILGIVAKLMIVRRWDKLDPERGAEFFRKLVKEIRATYDNKKQI